MHSRGHLTLDPENDEDAKKYYDYSFPDLGLHDVPAQIGLVRNYTGVDKLTYMGHSQGTSQMFYALADNEKKILD